MTSKSVSKIPPGNFGIPLIRENFSFARDPDGFSAIKAETYGNIFKTHILGSPTIIVKGDKWVNYVLENENKLFINNFPASLRKLLGNSISTQHGDIHKNRRKILSKAFQLKHIESYKERLIEITNGYVQSWADRNQVDLYSELKKYSFDVACEFLVGEKNLSCKRIFADYKEWSDGMFSIPIRIPYSRFDKAYRARERICNFIDEILIKDSRDSNNVISILASEKLGIEEIKDQILMLLYAGHGTLASAMWMLCYQLYKNEECLEYFRNLLDQENDRIDKYIDALIRECLRISPPVGGGFRKVIETNDFEGFTFPKGWNVLFQIRETELDDAKYDHPHVFDPKRILTGNDKRILAFGGGMRECIGKELAKQELKIFSMVLAKNYKWNFIDKDDIELSRIPVTHPAKETFVYVQKI